MRVYPNRLAWGWPVPVCPVQGQASPGPAPVWHLPAPEPANRGRAQENRELANRELANREPGLRCQVLRGRRRLSPGRVALRPGPSPQESECGLAPARADRPECRSAALR